MDLDFLVDLLLMNMSDGKDDKQGMIQPLFLVTSSLIHLVLLLMLTEVSTMPVVWDFGFSQEGRTTNAGLHVSHILYFIQYKMCMLQSSSVFDHHSP